MWKLIKVLVLVLGSSCALASFESELKSYSDKLSAGAGKKELQVFIQNLKMINESDKYSMESITLEKALKDLLFVDVNNKEACSVYQSSLFVSFGVRENRVDDLPSMVKLAHKISQKLCEKAK